MDFGNNKLINTMLKQSRDYDRVFTSAVYFTRLKSIVSNIIIETQVDRCFIGGYHGINKAVTDRNASDILILSFVLAVQRSTTFKGMKTKTKI